MSTCVSAAGTPTASPCKPNPVPAAKAAAPATTPDRVAGTMNPTAPLLTIAAVSLAQLIPGVPELEGGMATVNTIGIAARAAMTNPAVGVAVGIAGTEALGYAKGLLHDAFSSQPAMKSLSSAAAELDKGLRTGLGIPPTSDQ